VSIPDGILDCIGSMTEEVAYTLDYVVNKPP
jgi:hypothetical protein